MEKPRPFRLPADAWAYVCCLALWALSTAVTWRWLRIDQMPLGWDQMERMIQSVSIYRTLGHPTGDVLAQIAAAHDFYPPLQPLAAAAGYALFGVSADVGVAVSAAFFLGVLILATYDLGKTLGGPRVGLLAAFIVATYPSIFGGRDGFDVDLALTAQVALFMALLLRSRGFTLRGWSVAAGMAAGLAMLTKWTFPAFVAAPALYLAIRALARGPRRGRVLANVGLALACCLLIAAAWWAFKGRHIVFEYLPWAASAGLNEGDPELFVAPFWALTYYLLGMNYQLSFFYFALFGLCLPFYLIGKRALPWHKVTLVLWLAVPYAAFTVFTNKEPRYYEPAYPAMALITAAVAARALGRVRRRGPRLGLVGLPVAFALFQLWSVSFGFSWLPANARVPRVPNEGRFTDRRFTLYLYSQSYGCAPHPDPDDWCSADIQALIDRYRPAAEGLKIVIFSEQPQLKYPLVYRSFVEGLDYTVQNVGLKKFKEKDYASADFVLVHTPPQILSYRSDSPEIAERIADGTGHFEELNAERGEFEPVRTLDLHDGSRVAVYVRAEAVPGD